jgi:1-acyl-sn-glycerol-3-phosphate acyltransferase
VAASSRLTSRATRLLRLLRVGLHIAWGVAVAALVFPFAGRAGRRAQVQRWSCQLLDILAVRLRVRGQPPQLASVPALIVSNHVSWLDIIAINAVLPVRFVAKSEVRQWPVIGWLCERAGTLFIRRARRRDTALVNETLAQVMRDGEPVGVFPEATTGDGSGVLKFHPSLLQPAVLAGATLCPVALRYARADGSPSTEAAFLGDETLWDSLWRIATRPVTIAELAFLTPIESAGRRRHELADATREAILRSLFPPARDSRS